MNGDIVLGSNQQNNIVLNGDFKATRLIFGRKFNNSMKYQSLNMAVAMTSNSTFTLPSIAYYHFNISSITSNGLVTLTEVMIDVTSINKNNVVFTNNTGDLVNDDVVMLIVPVLRIAPPSLLASLDENDDAVMLTMPP